MNHETKENKKENPKYYAKLFGFRKVVPIILAALGIFIAVCFFTEGAGLLGGAVSALLKGLFSVGAYFIPALLLLHAIFYAGDYVKGLTISRTIFSVVTVFLVSGIEYIAMFWSEPVFAPAACYTAQEAGGFLGSIVAFVLTKMLGPVGLIILSVTIIAVYATYFFATGNSTASRSVMRVFSSVKEFAVGVVSKIKGAGAEKKAKKAELERAESEKRTGELLADNFFSMDDSVSELKIEKLGIDEKQPDAEPVPEIQENIAEKEVKPVEENTKKAERPRRTLNLDYGLGIECESTPKRSTTVPANPIEERATPKTVSGVSRAAMGLDDSADNVFTKEFDPFDFATAEKIIAKPSKREASRGINEVTTPLSSITEQDMAQLKARQAEQKRLAEFEEKKRRIIENVSSKTTSYEVTSVSEETAYRSGAPAQPSNTYSTPVAPAQPSNAYSAPVTTPQPSNAYSAPVATPQPSNAYSAPVAPAQSSSTYSAPVATAQSSSSYSAQSAEKAKTIEFNITPDNSSAAPSVGEGVTFVFDKSVHHPDETQKIADEVAKMLEENVTGYTRSANKSFTYTKVSETPDYAPSSESDSATITLSENSAEPVAYSQSKSLGDVSDNVFNSFRPDTSSSIEDADTASAEETAPEMSINEYSTAQSDDVSESANSFEEYHAPSVSEENESESQSKELKLERTMLEPAVSQSDIITERDKRFTVISADTESEYDKEAEEPSASSLFDALAIDDEENVTELSFGEESGESETMENSAEDISAIFGDMDDEDEDEDESTISSDEIPEEESADEPVEIPPEEQNPDILKQRQLFPFLDNPTVSEGEGVEGGQNDVPISDDAEEADEPPFDVPAEPESNSDEAAAPVIEQALITEKDAKKSTRKAPSYKNFKFPPIDMLGINGDVTDSNVDDEIQENADRLIDTLSSFNVTASIKGVDRGPRITRYEVVPAKGVKVSSIMSLQDDIALSLAADGIRMEAPIPGKSAVGVEIPNKNSTTVRLRELLETDEFRSEKSKTAICIGKDVAGQPVINDIAKMPHLLIAGATGMGKSVCINSLLISILYKARPDEVKFIMIDPKQVEFTMYNGIPHLLIPVVSDAKQAAGALMWAVDEMEKRFTQLNSACVRNIDGYNEKVAEDPSIGEPMSKIIIVIDEFADLMLQVKDPVESLVMRIAQKARAAGIHLIVGTQRPSTNVITGTIKANIPSRISCKVASNVDSRTVLDSVGAEKLLNRGDMLFAYAGAIKPLRVQGAFVSDGEVQNIMNHLKQFSTGDNYDEAVMEEIKRQAAKCNKKGSEGDDDRDSDDSSGEGFLNDRQFLEAVEVAVNSGKISTSLLQRKISIGYGKAAKFIDVMCDMGIVGESNGSKPREVLITADEWREKLSRLSYD